MIDLLQIVYGYVQEFHSYRGVTIASEELKILGLCSALTPFEQGGILTILQYLPWQETLIYTVSSEG